MLASLVAGDLARHGVPTRNLAASLSMSGQSGVVPIKLYTVGVAASDVEALRVGRTVSDGGGFGTASTVVHQSFALPNGAGVETECAAIACQLTSNIGPSAKLILRTLNAGALTDWFTLGNAGAVRFHGGAYAAAGIAHFDASGNISDSLIVNADVDAAAAIAGTKIAPAFGAQNISQTGATSITAGSAGFVGPSIDTAGATGFSIGAANATSVTVNSTTGVVTYQKATVSARVDTFDSAGANTSVYAAGVTSIADTWTTAAAGIGGQRSWSGQQGAAGSIGGALKFSTGAGGVPGTQLSGAFIVELGTLVSQASALFRLESTGGALIGSMGSIAGPNLSIKNGTATTAGIYMQSTAAVTIEAVTVASLASTGNSVWLQPSTGIVDFYKGSSLGAVFTFDPTAAMSLAMQARASTGANNGVALTVSAQAGQAQSGGSANNNGGDFVSASGVAGTGGGGAAGTDGSWIAKTGSTSRITITSTGAQAHQTDNFENIVTTAGTLKLKVESQGRFTTSNNTPANKWSYTLPSTFVGSVAMIVDMIDITVADDQAHYRREYEIKRRGAGAVTLTAVGVDTESETDATWHARMVESGGVLSLEITGDATNQTDGGARIVLEITTYSIA
jgi:hypothetical protein